MAFVYDLGAKRGVRFSDAELLEELAEFVEWVKRGKGKRSERGRVGRSHVARTGVPLKDAANPRHSSCVARRHSARRYGRGLGVREFAAWPGRRRSQNTYIRRFGSWREAMRRVGVEGVRSRRYPAEELFREAERVWRELGRAPGETTLPRLGRFSLNAYKRHWGSPEKLCAMIAAVHRGEMTREEALRGVPGAWKRRTIPVQTRWAAVQRDGHRCVACGASPANRAGVELQIDHVVPVSRGGTNDLENLRTLCRECNVGRSDDGGD